jgi:hypothetical protein
MRIYPRATQFYVVAEFLPTSRSGKLQAPRASLPLGATDAKERIERLDKEALEAAIIYPPLAFRARGRNQGYDNGADYQYKLFEAIYALTFLR